VLFTIFRGDLYLH